MPFVWMLAQVTCPIVLAGTYFHFGVHLVWVVVTNAAIYALVGLGVESLREHLSHAK
jgi:hypothetical protein